MPVIDNAACDIEIGFGRKNVMEAIDILEDEGFVGVIGVADADFDRLLGVQTALKICASRIVTISI